MRRKMRRKMKTKITAILMTVIMVLTLAPSIAYGEEEVPWGRETMHRVTFYDDDGTPLKICHTPDGWIPKYEEETPTKPSDANYTYTFAGWSPKVTGIHTDMFYQRLCEKTPASSGSGMNHTT